MRNSFFSRKAFDFGGHVTDENGAKNKTSSLELFANFEIFSGNKWTMAPKKTKETVQPCKIKFTKAGFEAIKNNLKERNLPNDEGMFWLERVVIVQKLIKRIA